MISNSSKYLQLHVWLTHALHASRMSQAALAAELNNFVPKTVDRSVINKMVLGTRKISAEEMLLISQITDFPLPGEQFRPTISIAGQVGAGARIPLFDAYEKGDGPQVQAPPQLSAHGIVAVEVVGDSMEPVYNAGDLLFYTRDTADGVPDDVVGYKCVCEDMEGNTWVKQVRRGSAQGLFNLVSINPGADSQHDVKLKWAAKVKMHLPADLAIRVL